MPRKRCCGKIEQMPCCRRFIPEGEFSAGSVELFLEELEALRLKDIAELDQTACSLKMGLSRTTFQRILNSARRKVALALLEGQSISIEGGNYIMQNRIFECVDCAHQWEEKPCTLGGKHGYEIACPACGSMKKSKLENGTKHACGGENHEHGHSCCGNHK
ncbi:DUF134 domain-containing protein [bacterium BFN5]|nr:DUF134 domain-containing protein [bacterium BFN5]QJW45229.1 DUF134 domain-containing protein [bacterium BFN5]